MQRNFILFNFMRLLVLIYRMRKILLI